ncbi:MAG TPA: ribonuclease H-like domain-containing protein [Acidobacteriota bacterium]|nr:ribonuclease H-like domain-containing protein [Acidobacteriota bacterium]
MSTTNSSGETYICDKIYIEYHGQLDLKNFPELHVEPLRFLTIDSSLQTFNLRKALFFDIETTGTAGGTGTYAFLVGFGFVEEGYFQIRQFFLHDLAEEAAFLQAIFEFVQNYEYLVTYNGKCFDTQILKNRYLMHRRENPLENKAHVDMLFVARRLWKRMYSECDLVNLERCVLQFYRENDIPGHLIPSAYANYLRYASTNLIQEVLHHNQLDILSLAVLTAKACLLKQTSCDASPEENFSLGLLYERQKEYRDAIDHLIRALQSESGRCRDQALMAIARNLRRIKDIERMQWLLSQTGEQVSDAELCRKLCILCEHDMKDPELAMKLVEGQIKRHEKFSTLSRKHSDAILPWYHRKKRLERKLARLELNHAKRRKPKLRNETLFVNESQVLL